MARGWSLWFGGSASQTREKRYQMPKFILWSNFMRDSMRQRLIAHQIATA
jgi:hypothetical protein